jgi:hypothetical protein
MQRLFACVLAVVLVLQPVVVRAEDPMVAILRRWIPARILVSGHEGLNEAWFQHGITRAELATWFAAALGRRAEAGARQHEVPFADLNGHWAAGYVAVIAGEGLVNGYGDDTFRPDERATALQLKMMTARLLRVGEPTAANVDALLRQAGVDPTLPVMNGDGLSRGQVMVLMDRALSVPLYARWGQAPAVTADTPLMAAAQRMVRYGLCTGGPCWDDPDILTGPLHRSVLAALFTIALGRRGEAQAWQGPAPFSDLTKEHWAAGFAAVAKAEGLVKGGPDGTFRPDEPATGLQLKLVTARLLRLGPVAPDQVDTALRQAGVDPALPVPDTAQLRLGHALLLLDRAMSTPIYARFHL